MDTLLHALALHETRGPFKPTLMHIGETTDQSLDQVWFPGSHGDVGRENETGCIGDAVLAWIICRLEEAGDIVFDEDKLRDRFPRMGAQIPLSQVYARRTEFGFLDPMRRPFKGLWRLMGRETRVPGSSYQFGFNTNESVHVTARLRGYGRLPGQPAVPGYKQVEKDGAFSWVKHQETSWGVGKKVPSWGSMAPPPLTVPEAPLSQREAELLGISLD